MGGRDLQKINTMDFSAYFFLGVIFLAVFTQTLAGFGSGLVAMALLPPLIGLRVAAPVVALMSVMLETVLLIRHRDAINPRAVWRLIAGALIGIPLGIFFLRSVDERISLGVLGIIIVAYTLYALGNFHVPHFAARWSYFFGFIAGLFGGAYNSSGPPVVIYGNSQHWQPREFKGNLQSFFILNSALTALLHALTGNVTPVVLRDYALSLPLILLGLVAGFVLERWLSPARFRQMVLLLLVPLGLRMLF